MNMWMGLPASQLCNKHLIGVHGELHKFLHNWEKQRSMDGYIENNCIEPSSYKQRHDEVANEMLKRGMNYKSPLSQPDFSYLPVWQQNFKVDKEKNKQTLLERCEKCKSNVETV